MQSSPSPAGGQRSLRHLWAPILGLGLTQLIGWGTSFSALTVLGEPIARELHLAREQAFGGITVMLLVSAVLAPNFGRRIDADGARRLMVPGTLVGAVALLVIAAAQGAYSYWLGWAIFGLAVAMMLTNAAVPALVQIAGPDARRAVTATTIITGITSVVFLPLTSWLEQVVGWRITLLMFSLLYLVVCLPIHLAVLPHQRPARVPMGDANPLVSGEGQLPETRRRIGFWLLALWMALQGLVVWGFNIQVINILEGVGLSHAAAIGVWMLSGPAQAAARVADLASGGRSAVMSMALLASAMAPLGFAVVLFSGASIPAAAVLAIAFGMGQGLYAVARNLVPLRLFGLKTYGTTMGQLTLPLNLSSAAAPLIFSIVVTRAGAGAAMWLAAAAGLLSFIAVLVLNRIAAVASPGSDLRN